MSAEINKNQKVMFLTTDESSKRDFRQVIAINDENADFKLYDYVLIEDIRNSNDKWIGQITAPNINVSSIGSPYDLTILHALKLHRAKQGVRLAETVESWQITLLGEYRDQKLSTLRRRPKPGATVSKLAEAETLNVLNIPPYTEESPNAIGYLINAENVPLCTNRTIFTHHILVSGGTGSGKSNTSANLIKQAANQGLYVFLYDAKPDYRKIVNKNSDPRIKSATWDVFKKYGIQPKGADNVIRMAIYNGPNKNYDGYDLVIGFRASDFEPYMFADLFFDESANVNQYEEFASICSDLKDSGDGDTESDRIFSLKNVEDEVNKRWKAYIEDEKDQQNNKKQSTQSPSDRPVIHPKTAETILRKVRRIKKNMLWLDSTGKKLASPNKSKEQNKNNAFDAQMSDRKNIKEVEAFSSEAIFKLMNEKDAKIVHIDCSESAGFDARTYALFLTRFLYVNQAYQTKNRNPTNGVVEFVDEAHRLFTNSSRYKEMLARTFNRTMVEGRSLGHGVIISLQNASQVPAQLLNNINTHIVMRQNNREVAKAATQTMGENFADQTIMLGTGEALCKTFESPVVVLAQMAPSPYELERTDNTNG